MDTSKTALFNRLVDAWTKVNPASSPYTTLHTRQFKLFCEAMGLSVKYTGGVGIELTDVSRLISAEDMAKCGQIAFTGFGVTGAAVQLSNPTPYDMFNDGRSVAYREGLKLGHLESKERVEQLERELRQARMKIEEYAIASLNDNRGIEIRMLKSDLAQASRRNQALADANNELYVQRALIEDLRIEADAEKQAHAATKLEAIENRRMWRAACARNHELDQVDHWKRAHDDAIGSPCGDTNDVAEYWHDKWKEADERLYPLLSELEATKLELEDRYGSVAQANHDMYSEQIVPLALELERVRKEHETTKLELEETKLRELLRMAQWSDAIGTLSESVEREAKLVEALESILDPHMGEDGIDTTAREALDAHRKARGGK